MATSASNNDSRLTVFWKGDVSHGDLTVGKIDLIFEGQKLAISLNAPKQATTYFVPLKFDVRREFQELVRVESGFQLLPCHEVLGSLPIKASQLRTAKIVVCVFEECANQQLRIQGVDGRDCPEVRCRRTDEEIAIVIPDHYELPAGRNYQLSIKSTQLDYLLELQHVPLSAAAEAAPTQTAEQQKYANLVGALLSKSDQKDAQVESATAAAPAAPDAKKMESGASAATATATAAAPAQTAGISLAQQQTTQFTNLLEKDLDAALKLARSLIQLEARNLCLKVAAERYLALKTSSGLQQATTICKELPEGCPEKQNLETQIAISKRFQTAAANCVIS